MTAVCPLCQNHAVEPFFEVRGVPASIGIQWPTAAEARSCKRGDLSLAFCERCGFIWNREFDPARLEYSQRYDNALDFSPRFREYAQGLARRLVESYAIRGKRVVEIGCGKGHFLSLICEEGKNTGIGFDPSFEGERVQSPAAERIAYRREFYGESQTAEHGDLVCCRHVFEHIPDVLAFLQRVRKTIAGNSETVVYFEVPDARYIIEKLSIWDIIYEHCNYFTRESLTHAFRRSGFEVARVDESYGGQFLSVDARLAARPAPMEFPNTGDLRRRVEGFAQHARDRLHGWGGQLAEMKNRGHKAVVWGGGSKAVSFLNMLGVREQVPYVVDINPHKQGRYLPGTGQQIVGPAALQDVRPDVVILMNPLYRSEVESDLAQLGLRPEIVTS